MRMTLRWKRPAVPTPMEKVPESEVNARARVVRPESTRSTTAPGTRPPPTADETLPWMTWARAVKESAIAPRIPSAQTNDRLATRITLASFDCSQPRLYRRERIRQGHADTGHVRDGPRVRFR